MRPKGTPSELLNNQRHAQNVEFLQMIAKLRKMVQKSRISYRYAQFWAPVSKIAENIHVKDSF